MPSFVCNAIITVCGVECVTCMNSIFTLPEAWNEELADMLLTLPFNFILSSAKIPLSTSYVKGVHITLALKLFARYGIAPRWSRWAWVGKIILTFDFQSSMAEMSGTEPVSINSFGFMFIMSSSL